MSQCLRVWSFIPVSFVATLIPYTLTKFQVSQLHRWKHLLSSLILFLLSYPVMSLSKNLVSSTFEIYLEFIHFSSYHCLHTVPSTIVPHLGYFNSFLTDTPASIFADAREAITALWNLKSDLDTCIYKFPGGWHLTKSKTQLPRHDLQDHVWSSLDV